MLREDDKAMFHLNNYTPGLEGNQFILESGGLWEKGIQQNKNGTHRLSDVIKHLEKLLQGVLEK